MNNSPSSITEATIATATGSDTRKPQGQRSPAFEGLLSDSLADQQNRHPSISPGDKRILVGEISRQTPTVSQLLINHDHLRASTWKIIHSEINDNKDYTHLKPGTRIYYNQADGALSWSQPNSQPATPEVETVQRSAVKNSSPERSDENHLVSLGRVSNAVPTVSHLLKQNPQLREHTWKILGHQMNREKPFDRIPRGTEIYFDPKSKEITWRGSDRSADQSKVAVAELPPPSPPPSATDLSEAVRGYMGTSYDKINCYELIVKGLDNMKIPYSGPDGIFMKLTRMAADKGVASNSFLNGEGIIKAAGSLIYTRTYPAVDNWQHDSQLLNQELRPLLDSGQILSFSTRKRGHTGIISRQNDQWTYINSGRLDNSISPESIDRGVGEEKLEEEIRNWFKLAHDAGDSLSVTLGRLNEHQVEVAARTDRTLSKRI